MAPLGVVEVTHSVQLARQLTALIAPLGPVEARRRFGLERQPRLVFLPGLGTVLPGRVCAYR